MASISSPPPALSAVFKNSFAYKTVKDRLPVILTKAIDTTHRHKHEITTLHGDEGCEDLKNIIHQLSELRYRLTTDKPLTPINSQKPDVAIWNSHLEKLESTAGHPPSWYKNAWLDVECYFYRKIQEAFETSRYLVEWDPFRFQKEQSFVGALEPMKVLAEHVKELLEKKDQTSAKEKRQNIEDLLQIALWGNKADLSISSGEQHDHADSPLKQVETLRDHILLNDLPMVLGRLFHEKNMGPTEKKRRVDFILDNAGLELFADLCLGELLLTYKLCDQVVYHVKNFPWFVSDTTCADFYWTLEMLLGSQSEPMSKLGEKWQHRLEDNSFHVKSHAFWTLPFAFNHMPRMGSDLWQYINDGGLLAIFKGDLNYRKLIGDLAWPSTTPLRTAVQEFLPKTPFVVLRTMKADVVTGMKEGEAEKMSAKDPKWMISGDYAVIQYLASE